MSNNSTLCVLLRSQWVAGILWTILQAKSYKVCTKDRQFKCTAVHFKDSWPWKTFSFSSQESNFTAYQMTGKSSCVFYTSASEESQLAKQSEEHRTPTQPPAQSPVPQFPPNQNLSLWGGVSVRVCREEMSSFGRFNTRICNAQERWEDISLSERRRETERRRRDGEWRKKKESFFQAERTKSPPLFVLVSYSTTAVPTRWASAWVIQ